jgi:hypothetical protein
MYQLIILLPTDLDMSTFDQGWPAFLKEAEQMPGLVQESVTRVDRVLYGSQSLERMYSFTFADKDSLENALLSPAGEKAGSILHELSGGRLTILTGEFKTDTLERILKDR